MIDDVFCKIISGEMATEPVYRDDDVIVIRDIHPQAPVHLLVIPVKHFSGLDELGPEDEHLLGKLLMVVRGVAEAQGLQNGYRLIINEGTDGGKLVPHFHIHLLGGKKLGPKIVQD